MSDQNLWMTLGELKGRVDSIEQQTLDQWSEINKLKERPVGDGRGRGNGRTNGRMAVLERLINWKVLACLIVPVGLALGWFSFYDLEGAALMLSPMVDSTAEFKAALDSLHEAHGVQVNE